MSDVYEITVEAFGLDVHVTYIYIPEEPCRPHLFDPGSPAEYELLAAYVDTGYPLFLDVSHSKTAAFLLEKIYDFHQLNKAA